MKIIPNEEEVVIDAIPLDVKSPNIVDLKIHKDGKKSYYQIIRADGNSKMYMVFNRMLKKFDREDLEDLYNLVKAKYGSTRPVEDLDLLLGGNLKTMFEPHVEDQVWMKQHGYKVLESKLYDFCKVGDAQLTGLEIIHETTKKIFQIKKHVQAARNRQKSLSDRNRNPMKFQVRDMVMLKVSPKKGVIRFGKRRKLNPHYIGPFKVLTKVGTASYRLKLPDKLSSVHSTFHVSNLKKCYADELLAISLDEFQIDGKLNFIKETVEIMDREVKQLKQICIPIVKVHWNSRRGLEFT
uniref:Putative reverse transcriptase domain-containing protein n=1 Tax=Tanacetum cinerariifolium TaxID=118510 RepID=A0A699GS60_TANCI|nr:putative reverse transcriptase domain-containing protein [Tanacetum cinerariifolium]